MCAVRAKRSEVERGARASERVEKRQLQRKGERQCERSGARRPCVRASDCAEKRLAQGVRASGEAPKPAFHQPLSLTFHHTDRYTEFKTKKNAAPAPVASQQEKQIEVVTKA